MNNPACACSESSCLRTQIMSARGVFVGRFIAIRGYVGQSLNMDAILVAQAVERDSVFHSAGAAGTQAGLCGGAQKFDLEHRACVL